MPTTNLFKKKKFCPNQNLNFSDESLPKSLNNLLMAQNQLIDSLTTHISLYNSHAPSPNPNPNPRSSILKWFSSLTVHQRQAHLTTVDPKFTQLLIQMIGKLRNNGHGCFIILPDLPSRDPLHLPSVCFKKSRGLLARFAESNESERLIFDSTRLFWSREGERIEECSCSIRCLDSATFSGEFVENVDRFVETMDRVSNGGFLRGEESELGSDWVELEWLKAKGYYSVEAFVANRLEVALRLAWLNCNNGKKRGVKLKEKVSASGVMANVFWRKKGCADWWVNMDAETKRKVLVTAVGKAAKSLTLEILNGARSSLKDEMWLFSGGVEKPLSYNYTESSQRTIPKPSAKAKFGSAIMPVSGSGKATSLANAFNGIFVLQDIISVILSCLHSEYDVTKLFFSTFGSVSTISDCVFRKLRGFLMVLSLDCTKLELLGEGSVKSSPKKSKEKVGASVRRKKGKARNTKRPNSMPSSFVKESSSDRFFKDHERSLVHTDEANLIESTLFPSVYHQKDIDKGTSSSALEMEHAQGLVVGNGHTPARKSRRGKNKNKASSYIDAVEVRNSKRTVAETSSCSVISHSEASKSNGISDNLSIQNTSNDSITVSDFLALTSSIISAVNEHNVEGVASQSVQEDPIVGSLGSDHRRFSKGMMEDQTLSSRVETSKCQVDLNAIPPVAPAPQLSSVLSIEEINFQNSLNQSETEAKLGLSDKSVRAGDEREDCTLFQERENRIYYDSEPTSSLECFSYEWPSVAPVYFPSINSHLPAATDRLHLDVGRNWQNRIRQSFVPTIHQARNPSIEGGCNQILARPLPMSLDWPPMVRSGSAMAPSVTCNYDSGYFSRRKSAFKKSFTAQNMQFNAKTSDDERKYTADIMDLPEQTNKQELVDECDSHWVSEEEVELHAVSGIDYNQHFGGGVMYWDPSDHPGTGFSRPPSLSSDDSSWAWREADMNRAVDDMVAFSSSYSTNGLSSPTAAPFCSPFDPLGPGHQALGYVVQGNEVPGKLLHSSSSMTDAVTVEEVSGSLANLSGDAEGKAGDPLPYPILRPIIIPNMSRERSRSEFKRNHDHKSPCVPHSKCEQHRIKRPPSPVVLCVPRAPRPPPPSPVSDSRKHRGFPTVRSGSSSPRHWGVRGWYHDGTNFEETCLRMDGAEVVWPSWRNKNLSTRPMIQPLPGALLQDRLIAISQLARDQEHPDVALPLQPPELQNCPTRKAPLSLIQSLLHDEIDSFCKQVAAENMARKPYINWAVKRVTRSLQVLWPRSRTNIFGSKATGLSLPTSDVDLVVCLPPVRNLEPIKEAGILEGRNGIKETCLQHAARYLANQEWVKNDSLKTVENTAIPIIMLVVEVPHDLIISSASNVQSPKVGPTQMTGEHSNHVHSDMVDSEESASPECSQLYYDNTKDVKSVRLDISFKTPSHTGLQTTELVKELTEQFPAATPLALVLKQFLADRSLDQSYSGGLSSYCLVLLITRFLQHEHHHGRPINQKFGSLLMDFLYFFGNVFDPRQMRISVQGSGVYISRERGHSIDPIHIDDPLFPTNNVGRNCFRIHQCIKAFSEAYSILENELTCLPNNGDTYLRPAYRLLSKLIPSINTC
ncbi:NTP_transf_2 domain-containing protein/PAP_assoc domain-containing protein [Cephalotus follicularis]|uniref:NTP_transf_2 domain-containing protein/PAP_assoc domain-containing protein n=1 Tax=Cephalotus follicularis TaxID=3775 RepID=A0A1Q3B2N9_CEPFO|nr:NTP_transf_2 domain-containing protein/PAP_assoc domain-containing protein [Cephalotus follicularis]